MGLHIIVDGYNLIRRSNVLAPLDQTDLELGRDSLLDRLAAYKKLKGHQITVVFDGAAQYSVFDRSDRQKGINIRFSRHGETADAVIKRMALREGEKALVVSSDREVSESSAATGAAVIGAGEFEDKLAMAEYMAVKGASPESENETGWTPNTKKKGPSRKPPKRRRKNQRKIRKL
ncbi:MAG: NYN domain-containing protein [Thermodesulfobacteriota bacterium]